MDSNKQGQALTSALADTPPLRVSFTRRDTLLPSLERLVEEVRPAVRRRLQQKGISGEELEDLHLETLERFSGALTRRSQCSDNNRIDIEEPTRYALTVADTVFDDHLRRTRPNWCRLKRRILYLLDNNQTKKLFARWKHRTAWIAGFTRWNLHPFRPSARYHAFCNRPALFCQQELGNQEPDKLPLPTLMAHLFRWLGTPVEVDELTTHLAALQNITDTRLLSLEGMAEESGVSIDCWIPPSEEDVSARVLDAMEGETFRARLWEIVCSLPIRQRHALLLGMSSDELLLLAPTTELAAMLEMSCDALTNLWCDLPLSDTQIAPHLEITPKQVSNLRKCARERIARNMKL